MTKPKDDPTELSLHDVIKAIAYSLDCKGGDVFYLNDIHRLHGTVKSAWIETEDGEEVASGTMREVLTQAKEKGLL